MKKILSFLIYPFILASIVLILSVLYIKQDIQKHFKEEQGKIINSSIFRKWK